MAGEIHFNREGKLMNRSEGEGHISLRSTGGYRRINGSGGKHLSWVRKMNSRLNWLVEDAGAPAGGVAVSLNAFSWTGFLSD